MMQVLHISIFKQVLSKTGVSKESIGKVFNLAGSELDYERNVAKLKEHCKQKNVKLTANKAVEKTTKVFVWVTK